MVAEGLTAALGLPMPSLLSLTRCQFDEAIVDGEKRTERFRMAVWTNIRGLCPLHFSRERRHDDRSVEIPAKTLKSSNVAGDSSILLPSSEPV